MRWQTGLSLIACGLGLLAPAAYLYRWIPDKLGQLHRAPQELVQLIAVALIAAVPYVLVAGCAWAVRGEGQRSSVLTVVAIVALALGLGGWAWAAGLSRQWEHSVSLLVIAGVQLLVWLAGSIVASGSRRA